MTQNPTVIEKFGWKWCARCGCVRPPEHVTKRPMGLFATVDECIDVESCTIAQLEVGQELMRAALKVDAEPGEASYVAFWWTREALDAWEVEWQRLNKKS